MFRLSAVLFVCSGLSCVFFSPAVSATKMQHVISFNLPRASLNEALISFGVQAGVSVVVPTHYVLKHVSSEVVGDYAVEDALQSLLAQTGLRYEINTQTNAVVIKKNKYVSIKVGLENPTENNTQLLEEVHVVSARHRNEVLQDVPMSVVSFGAEELERTGTQNLVQLASYIPNTSFNIIRGTNSVLAAYIRGIGHANPIAGLETSIGTYIDDVFFNRPLSVVLDIYDAERVEILRGPQGTLYGRNTIGGAIKYVTKGLPESPSMSIKLAAGSYNQQDVIAIGGMPLGESFRVGGSIASLTRDGFGKNLTTGDEHYNKDIFAYRTSAEFEPSERFFVRASVDKAQDKSLVKSGHRLTESGPLRDSGNVYDTWAGITLSDHPLNTNSVTSKGESVFVRWNVQDNVTVESISAHRKDWGALPTDIDSTELRESELHPRFENAQSSQELRLAFDTGNIYGIFGLYLLDTKSMNAIDYITALDFVILTYDRVDAKSWSFFSSFDIAVSEALSFSLGARYTNENRDMTVVRDTYSPASSGDLVSPFFGSDAVRLPFQPPVYDENGVEVWPRFSGKRQDDSMTPALSASWKPAEQLHIYAAYRTGFKGGGFAPKGVFSDARLRKGFEPEEVTSYELGFKTNLFDSRMNANVSVFYSDYENIQVEAPLLLDFDGDGDFDGTAIATTNAESASISGAEFELDMLLLTNWQVDLSLGYTDAEFDRFIDDGGVNIAEQRAFVATPKTTASLSNEYTVNIIGGELTVSASINYRSSVTLFQAPSALVDQPGYSLMNVGLTWSSPNEAWQLGVYGLNLMDKRYRVSAYYESEDTEILAGGGLASVFFGDPRMVMGSVRVLF
ncbi:MAG: TonB-dependent receptor [Agarilytica sp.]